MDCEYKDYLTSRGYIDSVGGCQSACLAYSKCKFSLYFEKQSLCEMYGSLEKDCTKVRGLPYTNQEGCPSTGMYSTVHFI